MWREARNKAGSEAEKWPYAWVNAGNYAGPATRSTVKGRLSLEDPLVKRFPGRIMVGLAQPANQRTTWQTDAKHYQFWARSDKADGTFVIPKVGPGDYTLYAFADGVLGEFSKANIHVSSAQTLDLGDVKWVPARSGRQVWEIGVANRTGAEFAGGDRFFEPDITLQYPKLFPNDVTFTVGKSDPAKDWFYAHVPRNTNASAQVEPFRGVTATGQATPYTIRFQMNETPRGKAVLRLAICGTGTRAIDISVNGRPAGQVQLPAGDGVITRHQVQGIWYERQFEFDASQLKAGENTLTLTVPAGPVNNGVVYDYLRLELSAL
jgi:rhamnogalacturonan endolyase